MPRRWAFLSILGKATFSAKWRKFLVLRLYGLTNKKGSVL